MLNDPPFEIRGAKIPLFALHGAYNDLLGGVLDTSIYTPWTQVLDELKVAGVNNVTLMVSAGVMKNASDSNFDPSLNYNPDLQAVRQLASLIQARGMNVTLDLFPHVANVISGNASLAGADRPYPAQPQEWLRNFGDSVLQWARFATEIGATAFIPFGDTSQHLLRDSSLLPNWLQLIDQIRQNFSGVLSSNWWTPGYGDSISAIPAAIIEKLDYLGLGFFPNLTLDSQASIQDLTDAYHSDASRNDLLAFLQGLQTTYGKQIWISDKAFHSFDGASHDEGRIFDTTIPLTQDWDEQARLYDSFLLAMSRESGGWLHGVSFQSFNNLDDGSTFLHRFTNGPLSESPQGKPAMQVIADWFTGGHSNSGLVLTGSSQVSRLVGGSLKDNLSGGLGDDVLQGFGGGDVLVGGPMQSRLTDVYHVEVALRGVTVQGTAPIVQVRTNGGEVLVSATISSVFEVGIAASQQSGSPTRLQFDVYDLSEFTLVETNWAFIDFSSVGNRFVHIESVKVNGVTIDLSRYLSYQAPGAAVPQLGAQDSVHGGQFLVNLSAVTVSPDHFTPTDQDQLFGGDGHDALTGGFGNDTLDGGAGIDTALYAGAKSLHTITRSGEWRTVSSAQEGVDRLESIERLSFSDVKIAFDLDGNAGSAALIIGALLGKASLQSKSLVGTVVGLIDGGKTLADLSQMVVGNGIAASLAGGAGNDSFAKLILRNVLGSDTNGEQVASLTALLDSGVFTQASLLTAAANLDINKTQVNLVGLSQTGLEYI